MLYIGNGCGVSVLEGRIGTKKEEGSVMGEFKQVKASNCKCIACGKQAVAFWPCTDPDIKSNPYCRACLHKAQVDLLIAIHEQDEKLKQL